MSDNRGTRRGKRSKALRLRREADRRFGPDHSEVVHRFDDGWSVWQPTRVSDLRREGLMQRCCLATITPGDWEAVIYVLRDADNLSRLTIWQPFAEPTFTEAIFGLEPARVGSFCYGLANSKPKQAYLEYVLEWLATLPYDAPINHDDTVLFDFGGSRLRRASFRLTVLRDRWRDAIRYACS